MRIRNCPLLQTQYLSEAALSVPMRKLCTMQDHDAALHAIDALLSKHDGGASYHLLFTKALILRQQGHVHDSLRTLEAAVRLEPHHADNLKQVARSLVLVGKHSVALEVYNEAIAKGSQDWDLYHQCGICYIALQQLAECGPAPRTGQ
jgi:Bardet-Biedl syndrome 4 protein